MTKETTPEASVERLAREIYGRDPDDAFARELLVWLAKSARFRAFAEAHRDKIRKKLRTAGDEEALLDVRAELGAAHLLLVDRRIELAYEAYGSGNAGPDFTLTFRGTRACNVEVTRSRRVPDADALGWVILRRAPPAAAQRAEPPVDRRRPANMRRRSRPGRRCGSCGRVPKPRTSRSSRVAGSTARAASSTGSCAWAAW